MRKFSHLSSLLVPLVALGLMAGCSGQGKQEAAKKAQADQQITTIKTDWEQLKQARTELADARAHAAELQAEKKLSEEQQQDFEQTNTKISQLGTQVSNQYDALQGELADFLNLALNDYPQAPSTAEALNIYAQEAMVVAADHVKNSGNYKKAINILSTAKNYYESVQLPAPDELTQLIDSYEDLRYITKERFDAVEKGMSEDEVAEAAGQPYYLNKKEEKGIQFWLYPKREGGAAAVYFNKKGKVYNKNWEAVKATQVASN